MLKEDEVFNEDEASDVRMDREDDDDDGEKDMGS